MQSAIVGLPWSAILLLGAATLSLLFQAIRNYFYRGLHRYPGPFLANFTDLWYLLDVRSNQHHHHLIHLHRRHNSPVLRLGPNTISISQSDFLPQVFGVSTGFLKSEMYDAFANRVNGQIAHTSLSIQDPKLHVQIRKPITSAYSLTTVTAYEPLVDQMISKLIVRLGETSRGLGAEQCNMALWLRLYAHDVILHLTFSHTLGFMDAGGDIDGFISKLDGNLNSLALLSAMPRMSYWLKLNPVVAHLRKDSHMFVGWTVKRIQERIKERHEKYNSARSSTDGPIDFLDAFLDAAQSDDDPSGYNFALLIDWTLVNVMGGADTTAVALRAVLWFLLKDPSRKEKLLQEIHSARLRVPVSWKQTRMLPYLDACIKEALRLCPAIGLGLGRKVPAGGLQMPDGYMVPAGTNVSMNARVVNRQDIFGDDPDAFIPERWLRQGDETVEQHRDRTYQMKRADLTFGGGSRACTGRYIAFLEIYKVVPALLLEFDIEMADPLAEWVTINRWTVRQNDIQCRLKPRK